MHTCVTPTRQDRHTGLFPVAGLFELLDHIRDLLVCPSGEIDRWNSSYRKKPELNRKIVRLKRKIALEVLLFYFFNLQVADGLSDVVAVHAMTNTSTVPESVVGSAAR